MKLDVRADASRKSSNTSAASRFEFAAPRWKAADMEGFAILPGSALDLSSRPRFSPERDGEMQIGKEGAITFRTQNGKPVRLIGFNVFPRLFLMKGGSRSEIHEKIDRALELARMMGYDYCRILNLFDRDPFQDAERDFEFNPEFLDRLDYLVAAARKYGIYLYGTTAAYQLGRNSGSKVFRLSRVIKCETFFGREERRAEWRKLIVKLLTHVNPYTGIAYKDDPVFLCFEFFNEVEIFLPDLLRAPERYPAETLAFVNGKFLAFLKRKYGSEQKLAAAWGIPDAKCSSIVFYAPENRKGRAGADWEEFRMKSAEECLEFFNGVMREISCSRLFAQYNLLPTINFSRMRAEKVPIVSINTYFGHPSNMMKRGSRVRLDSSLTRAGSELFKKTASVRIAGKPLFITEYNHCYWNRYDYEGGLFFPAYSAFQGFSGLTVHSEPVVVGSPALTINNFRVADNPTKRANEFLSMALFRRGDVQQARHRVELTFPEEFFRTGSAGSGAVNPDQSALAFLTGFALRFPGMAAETGRKADLSVLPDTEAGIQSGDLSATIESGVSGRLAGTVAELRKRNILSPKNTSDPEKQLFVSETGELTLDLVKERLKIITPKTEAVTLRPNDANVTLGIMSVKEADTGCAAALTSLDDRPLTESRRMMFVLNTTSVAKGLVLSGDRGTLLEPGERAVPLMETARVSLSIRKDNSAAWTLHPLSLNGKRRRAIPVEYRNGTLNFRIDTASLLDGTTPFFELIAQ